MSLRRATRIRVFPQNAVIDKEVFMAERKTSSPCTLSKFHRAVKFCKFLRVFTSSSKIFHFHDFSAMRLQSTELFFNISVLLIRLLHAPCQQTIKYLLCIFSLLNDGIRQSWCCLCVAVRLGRKLKNLLMLLAVRFSSYGCTWEVWRALKKLELHSAIALCNSCASFVLSKLPACIYNSIHAR